MVSQRLRRSIGLAYSVAECLVRHSSIRANLAIPLGTLVGTPPREVEGHAAKEMNGRQEVMGRRNRQAFWLN